MQAYLRSASVRVSYLNNQRNENSEFKLTIMCNLYSIFGCISILKSCKPKLYCSLNDRQTSVPLAMCWIR